MKESLNEQFLPRERTEQLFSKDYTDLKEELSGKTVALFGSDKKIILDEVEGWNLESNVKTHKGFRQLSPGDWEASRIPVRRMNQSLIIAKDGDRVGACVRVVRASSFDPEQGQFVRMPREGDIANYLGLSDNELARLMYMDQSDMLYLVRGFRVDQSITPDQADEEMRNLFGGNNE